MASVANSDYLAKLRHPMVSVGFPKGQSSFYVTRFPCPSRSAATAMVLQTTEFGKFTQVPTTSRLPLSAGSLESAYKFAAAVGNHFCYLGELINLGVLQLMSLALHRTTTTIRLASGVLVCVVVF